MRTRSLTSSGSHDNDNDDRRTYSNGSLGLDVKLEEARHLDVRYAAAARMSGRNERAAAVAAATRRTLKRVLDLAATGLVERRERAVLQLELEGIDVGAGQQDELVLRAHGMAPDVLLVVEDCAPRARSGGRQQRAGEKVGTAIRTDVGLMSGLGGGVRLRRHLHARSRRALRCRSVVGVLRCRCQRSESSGAVHARATRRTQVGERCGLDATQVETHATELLLARAYDLPTKKRARKRES